MTGKQYGFVLRDMILKTPASFDRFRAVGMFRWLSTPKPLVCIATITIHLIPEANDDSFQQCGRHRKDICGFILQV
jgi:hypothetical protein